MDRFTWDRGTLVKGYLEWETRKVECNVMCLLDYTFQVCFHYPEFISYQRLENLEDLNLDKDCIFHWDKGTRVVGKLYFRDKSYECMVIRELFDRDGDTYSVWCDFGSSGMIVKGNDYVSLIKGLIARLEDETDEIFNILEDKENV